MGKKFLFGLLWWKCMRYPKRKWYWQQKLLLIHVWKHQFFKNHSTLVNSSILRQLDSSAHIHWPFGEEIFHHPQAFSLASALVPWLASGTITAITHYHQVPLFFLRKSSESDEFICSPGKFPLSCCSLAPGFWFHLSVVINQEPPWSREKNRCSINWKTRFNSCLCLFGWIFHQSYSTTLWMLSVEMYISVTIGGDLSPSLPQRRWGPWSFLPKK